MTRTEQRLADALAARADAVDASTVRPLLTAPTPERRPSRPSRRTRLWLAPAAAAISITLVTTVVTVASRHAPRASQDPVSAQQARFPAQLHGVDALSASNVWAVGVTFTQPDNPGFGWEPVITHWDGRKWRRVDFPTSRGAGVLDAIDGSSPSDLWAVGGWFPNRHHPDVPLIAHWNGKKWRLVRFPADSRPTELYGVSVRSATDAWAVGSDEKHSPVILHWDGHVWRPLPVPHFGTWQALNDVTAISADDAWAVGEDNNGEIALHWNGARWKLVPMPVPGLSPATLTGVSALSATEVWAGGTVADGVGLQVARWDGRSWKVMPDRGLPRLGDGISTVAATSPDDLWAVGSAGFAALISHWNGRRWSRPPGAPRDLGGSLNALSVLSANDIWAAGTHDGSNESTTRPLILHWNGTRWTKVLD